MANEPIIEVDHDAVTRTFNRTETTVFPRTITVVFEREDFVQVFNEVKPNGS